MAKGRRRDRQSSGSGARGRRPEEDAAPGGGIPKPPTWLPAVIFVGLTVALFRDFIFSDRMLYGGDTLSLGYVARAFYADALTRLGIFPRWNPQILGGTPFLEALSGGDSLYPPSVLLLLLTEPYRALGWKLVLHVALAGFFMFGWVRGLGSSRAAALVSGTAYMLAPYMISLVHPGHDGRLFVTALTPLLFWVVDRHFVRPTVRTFAAIALVIGGIILTTHFQMAYFLFGAVGLYAIFRSVVLWRTRPDGDDADEAPTAAGRVAASRFGLFLAASVAGAAVGAVQLLPAVDYVTESSRRTATTAEAAGERGLAWSSSWGMHPEEAMGLVIPEFAGNNAGGAPWAQNTYWGRNVFKDNHEGAGVVTLLLAVLAFAGGRRRDVRFFFAGLAGVAFLFALGTHTPLWRIFYEVVPGIRLFRAPAQVMFLFAFSAATLAAFGVDRLVGLGDEDRAGASKPMKVLWGAAGALGVLALLASTGLLTSFWTSVVDTSADAARLDRLSTLAPFITRGAWVSFALALGAAAVVWALRSRYLAPTGAVLIIGILVVTDELRVSDTFVQVIDFDQWAAPGPNMQAVLDLEDGSTEPYRMLSMAQNGQDTRPALYGIELAAGHHPNDLARYRELIGMVGSEPPMHLLESANIRRLLNVRYILWPDYALGQVGGNIVSRTTLPDGSPYETMLAEAGLPRARLVGGAVVQTDEDAVAYMRSASFDPEREVVLPEPPPIALDGQPPTGTVTWVRRTPNELALSVTTERPALLVVADNWFPAWRATVDGEETPILRAYHTLRAIPVEPGEHTVEMSYRSDVVARSLWVSLVVLVGLVGAAGFSAWRERSRRAS